MQFPALSFLVIGLIAAVIYLPHAGQKGGWRVGAMKTVPLACFAVASASGGGPAFLTMALLLSALGDMALSRPGRAAFLYGLCAFALAHLLYVLCFRQLGGLELWEAFAVAPILAFVLVLGALSTELWLAPHTGRLGWPVRGYTLLITLMGLAALVLPGALWLVTLGAALFIGSDVILSVRQFRLAQDGPAARPVSRALWVLYVAGQALILIGVLTA